jgi:hypothetical protein
VTKAIVTCAVPDHAISLTLCASPQRTCVHLAQFCFIQVTQLRQPAQTTGRVDDRYDQPRPFVFSMSFTALHRTQGRRPLLARPSSLLVQASSTLLACSIKSGPTVLSQFSKARSSRRSGLCFIRPDPNSTATKPKQHPMTALTLPQVEFRHGNCVKPSFVDMSATIVL